MRRITSGFVFDLVSLRDDFELKPSDRALFVLHLPWFLRPGESDLVRKNLKTLDDEQRENGDDDDDDDDDAEEEYNDVKMANFNNLIESCSTNVVRLFANIVNAYNADETPYHTKIKHAMSSTCSAAQRNAMDGLRRHIDNRLATLGFDNQHAATAIGRMRYAEALQRSWVSDDLSSEVVQQLSPSPKPRKKSFLFFPLPLVLITFRFRLWQMTLKCR